MVGKQVSFNLNRSPKNHILSALPSAEYQRLSDRLEPVALIKDDVLITPNRKLEWVYFPNEGIVSLILIMHDKSTTETGLIGSEGMVGTHPFLGGTTTNTYSIVQIEGTAMRIKAEVLRRECDRSENLTKALLHNASKLFQQVSQVAACNNHHTVNQRTARRLLMLADRTDKETLLMTHKMLSQILGVRRSGITETAFDMRQKGIIDYSRGKIKILDRQALETIACECYQVLKM